MLFLNRTAHILHDDNARVFDTVGRVWRRVPESAEGGSEIELFDAVRWLQRESGKPARAPVSIAGPRDASTAELADAEALGHGVAELGLSVLCGGLEGVMTAAAKGAHAAGGTVIGLLPDADWRAANPLHHRLPSQRRWHGAQRTDCGGRAVFSRGWRRIWHSCPKWPMPSSSNDR